VPNRGRDMSSEKWMLDATKKSDSVAAAIVVVCWSAKKHLRDLVVRNFYFPVNYGCLWLVLNCASACASVRFVMKMHKLSIERDIWPVSRAREGTNRATWQ